MATPPVTVRARKLWRRFRGRPIGMQAFTASLAVVLIADLVALGTVSPTHSANKVAASGSGGTSSSQLTPVGGGPTDSAGGPGGGPAGSGGTGGVTGTGPGGSGGGSGSNGGPSVTGPGGVVLTASDRGVTPTSIRVVFPWPNLSAVEAATGFSSSGEDDVTSIHTFVDDINNNGGINGRKIDPEIVSYDPTNDADMKAKCQQWTQVEKVFAVIDSFAWHDDNQLCITQQGHTPLISGWTTVNNQLVQGAPYLWWTDPEQIATLENLVAWGKSTGVLTPTTKFGIVYADRSSDTLVRQQFAAVLSRAGLKPADTETMHYDALDQSQAGAQGAVAVHNFQTKGVSVVFPLIPATTLLSYVSNEKSQSYYPKLMLSDFEQSIGAALGLLGSYDQHNPWDDALNNQVGTTSWVLANTDGPRATSPTAPGYNPQTYDCWKVWVKHNPNFQGANGNTYHGYIESTGVAATWCQNIRLFATAARAAGPNLTRDGFDAAMSRITNFPGTLVPLMSFSPTKHWGPTQFRVVEVHRNDDRRCPPKEYDNTPQGNCWMLLKDFAPLVGL